MDNSKKTSFLQVAATALLCASTSPLAANSYGADLNNLIAAHHGCGSHCGGQSSSSAPANPNHDNSPSPTTPAACAVRAYGSCAARNGGSSAHTNNPQYISYEDPRSQGYGSCGAYNNDPSWSRPPQEACGAMNPNNERIVRDPYHGYRKEVSYEAPEKKASYPGTSIDQGVNDGYPATPREKRPLPSDNQAAPQRY